MKREKGSKNKPIAERPVLCADGNYKLVRMTRSTAMTLFCTECLGFEGNPSVDCTSPFCPLFIYRKRTQKSKNGNLSRSEARKLV